MTRRELRFGPSAGWGWRFAPASAAAALAAVIALIATGLSPLRAQAATLPQAPPPSPPAAAAPATTVSAAAATAVEPEEPTTVFDHPDGWLWVAGQANFISQWHPAFRARYSGAHSLQTQSESALSRVISLYTGFQLGHGAELLVDAETAGGRGISDAFGLAGYTNLDVVRNPTLGDSPYLARAIYHQTFALGPERAANDRTPVSSAATVPIRRVDVWIGKLGTVDLFDLNAGGNDSHLQFLNWTVDDNGAYDYAADTRGYTYGAVAELHERAFSVRAGVMTMPKVANGIQLDPRLDRARGQNLEAEARPSLGGRKGAVRFLVYRNVADMGSYREAIDAFRAGVDPVPDITAHQRQGRTKTGVGLNFEQEVSDALRVFGRWGLNDGRNESFAYTEVDGTLEVGADLRLRHERHKLGLALADNRLSTLHRTYLALGGLGFLLGDGRLTYGHERIVEGYYTYRIWRGLSAAIDLQHVRNPGYNRDRGPVLVSAVRGHVDF